jgi:hypothetical protein
MLRRAIARASRRRPREDRLSLWGLDELMDRPSQHWAAALRANAAATMLRLLTWNRSSAQSFHHIRAAMLCSSSPTASA